MVLGLRTKNPKRGSVQFDYLVHVQELRPWPPSQSLRSIQSILLQWENGDQNSGSLASVVSDGKIEFNESFRLPVTLYGEASKKGTAGDSFQKNYLELYFYKTGTEKPVKGQLLGSAVINLADYGIINEAITISAPINFKKCSKNTDEPVLYFIVEPFYKNGSSSSSSMGGLLKEVSSDKDGSEFSELTNEGIEEGCEIASFTDDDDVSSHSLRTISSAFETTVGSPAQNCKSGSDSVKDRIGRVRGDRVQSSGLVSAKDKNMDVFPSSLSSTNLYSEVSSDMYIEMGISTDQERWLGGTQPGLKDHKITRRHEKNGQEVARTSNLYFDLLKDTEKKEHHENGQDDQVLEAKRNYIEDILVSKLPEVAAKREIKLRSNTLANNWTSHGAQSGTVMSDKLKHGRAQLHFDSFKSNGMLNSNQFIGKEKKSNIAKDNGSTRQEKTKGCYDSKVELKSKIEMLEDELREAAALEVGLYSIVAEHGSSTNKVHAPARRLSRFYFHACKAISKTKRASAARTVISGLVLVSKACGNDVPRLIFWLSNSVLLRAIVSQVVGRKQFSDGPHIKNEGQKGLEKSFSPKRRESSVVEDKKSNTIDNSDHWEDPQTLIVALEKLEAWIFSRIIESVWWQTLTPHMQSVAAKSSISNKSSGRRHGLGNQEQVNFSIEHWKKAFKDARERLCPVQARGHACGCLTVLAKLVMEQLVHRLDVAMLNAILRESADEMPTDPVSDPISDSKVLPIPAGKSSFGAGAQLKNAIGNWSRWLTDLFGIGDNDPLEDINEVCDNKSMEHEAFKPFPLLNALSDLMMLPFEMLADSSTRKEVCPMFGAPLIERVLNNFVPDEFNPEPIPAAVFESLESEGLCEAEEENLTCFPCTAATTTYSAPPAPSLSGIVGEIGNQTVEGSGSSVLRKSYTSEDELDELDSSITSIIIDNSHTSPGSSSTNWMPKGKRGRKVVRYQLLRAVWRDGHL